MEIIRHSRFSLQVCVNEASAQLCFMMPTLLTRRDELFPLARQIVRDSGYQYSKGHSRSQFTQGFPSKLFGTQNTTLISSSNGSEGAARGGGGGGGNEDSNSRDSNSSSTASNAGKRRRMGARADSEGGQGKDMMDDDELQIMRRRVGK
jgi:hypothetical protein